MASYFVSYDLNAPGQDYSRLFHYLKSHDTWWHHLDSTWVVVASLSAAELRDGIRNHIDSNDKVLVVKSAGVGSWYGIAESGSKWLKDHL